METAASTPTVDSESILAELMETFELPMLPETTSRLLQMCNDPDVEPASLADCIRSDASIAGHVLQLANSPLYGVGTQIASLKQAVARLGIKRLREIVLVVSCRERVFNVPGFEQEIRDSFRFSFATAVVSQEIARVRRLNVEDAFLCGLLHDVGRPVLLQAAVDFEKANKISLTRDELLAMVERNRTDVAVNLIKKWMLPDRIADTVGNQLESDAPEAATEAKLLSLACMLSSILMDKQEFDLPTIQKLSLVEQLNLYSEDVETVLETSQELLNTMGS